MWAIKKSGIRRYIGTGGIEVWLTSFFSLIFLPQGGRSAGDSNDKYQEKDCRESVKDVVHSLLFFVCFVYSVYRYQI